MAHSDLIENEEELLVWCKQNTEGYENVVVHDFGQSWRDGLALCALINKFHPDKLDYKNCEPTNGLNNISLAFKVGDQLGIPRQQLDAISLMAQPDPSKITAYLSHFYKAFGQTIKTRNGTADLLEEEDKHSLHKYADEDIRSTDFKDPDSDAGPKTPNKKKKKKKDTTEKKPKKAVNGKAKTPNAGGKKVKSSTKTTPARRSVSAPPKSAIAKSTPSKPITNKFTAVTSKSAMTPRAAITPRATTTPRTTATPRGTSKTTNTPRTPKGALAKKGAAVPRAQKTLQSLPPSVQIKTLTELNLSLEAEVKDLRVKLEESRARTAAVEERLKNEAELRQILEQQLQEITDQLRE